MLKRAMNTYNAGGGANRPLKQQSFPSSGTTQANSHSNVLNSRPPNTLNARPNPTIKRTASGLAKAVNGDADPFKDTADQALLIDDNDFDSDIDLEVEELATKPAPVKQASQPTAIKASAYPSIQKAHLHSQSTKQTSLGSASVPSSSIALPWSSSPDYQKAQPLYPNLFERFSYDSENRALATNDAHEQPEAHDDTRTEHAKERAPKRRTLPWLQADAEAKVNEAAMPTQGPTISTPAKMSPYPWNTTASAIKEQQKQLRKTNKKPTKASNASTATKSSKAVARPCLSDEQQHVLKLVVEHGKSVFFTGSAGTGKSVLLREIIAVLRKKYLRESDRVAITASTGLAACNIGGVTLHSFAGFGLGKEDVPELIKKIKRNQKARHRWMRTKVLIVDEVSMVDGELFDKLEAIARTIRNNGRPFGGIQLVVTGDFFQLPPVPDHGTGRAAKFSFDAQSWTSSIEHTIGLHHVFRQKDPKFASILNEMREGHLSQESVNLFRQLSRPLQFDDELQATELFPTRAEVENANNAKMRHLTGDAMVFEAKDGGSIVDKVARDKLLQNCMAPERLEIKKGAQVMLIKNIDEMLVNGSLGQVMGFMNEQTFDSYNADEDAFRASRETDESELNPKDLKYKRHVDSLLATTSQVWPLVRFSMADGTTRDLLCNRESWKVELPNGEVQASRAQVPLILAWALSIHKAQGQTLDRVKVDLGRVFEKGQAYVALSRATAMNGLQVLRFDPKKVVAHERVRSFYASLSKIEREEEASQKAQDDDLPDPWENTRAYD